MQQFRRSSKLIYTDKSILSKQTDTDMHLCYMYIFNYQGKIQNTGLTFNPNYEFSFESANNTLTIRKSDKPLPKDFWGEGIYSVTALLGNNGAGKSTVMSAIMEATVDGNGDKENVDAILVYEDDNGTLQYYCKNENIQVVWVENDINKSISNPERISINSFYYTGHFSPNVNDDIRWKDVVGLYNASDSSMLVQDYGMDRRKDDESMQSSLNDYLLAHVAQNNIRICELLSDAKTRELLKSISGFQAPHSLLLRPNELHRGEPRVNQAIRRGMNTIKSLKHIESEKEYEQDCCIANFIFQGFRNCIFDERRARETNRVLKQNNDSPVGRILLYEWTDNLKERNRVLPQFEEFVDDLKNKKSIYGFQYPYESKLRFLLDLLNYINKTARCAELCEHYHYSFEQKSDDIKELLRFNTPSSPISFFINFTYSKNRSSNRQPTLLSSGELAILNLFSRLYDATIVKLGRSRTPTLLLLDETELGLHPEWQRLYMNILLKFVQFLAELKNLSFQIVLASHSPILLSDIPRACSNYLFGNNENNNTDIKETFASNIFELYRNSFFMKNGMMGAFAEEKVQDLLERITNLENEQEDEKEKQKIIEIETEIEMIGDERIRLYLLHEMEKRIDQPLRKVLIAYYTEKIKQLKKGIES